jgi:hypothetical protein
LDIYYVATFHSVSQALRFEKLTQSQNIAVKMIPVPRVISSSCGIAARFSAELLDDVAKMLSSDRVAVEELYLFENVGKRMHTERVSLESPDQPDQPYQP